MKSTVQYDRNQFLRTPKFAHLSKASVSMKYKICTREPLCLVYTKHIGRKRVFCRSEGGHAHASPIPWEFGFQESITCVIVERLSKFTSHFPGSKLGRCQNNSGFSLDLADCWLWTILIGSTSQNPTSSPVKAHFWVVYCSASVVLFLVY